ncbi:hypothetical protein F7725_026200 [Dissostichus mawsoni]|uniref:Uncharacterized protein n=1 Tax=Dissostichus mawsoni TaxID=36200 RepID=A0A7J5X6H4_DISMA|nr:hypothetical protein F7725_026200 [Dissostichus mawsoni]
MSWRACTCPKYHGSIPSRPYPPNTPVDDLVACYNTALALSLDALAPLKTRTVSYNCPAPWFTAELRSMKAACRRLERLTRGTGLTVHLEAYKDHVRAYKEALTRTKAQYYSTIIHDQQHQPRKLFSTINRLLRPIAAPQPPGARDLCSDFLDFFQAKVNSIHLQLNAPAPPAPHTAHCDRGVVSYM